MIGLIERRLDNVVHRLGLAASRRQGRQLVRHNHILVNGKRLNIPSYSVSPGDKVEVREKSRKIAYVAAALASAEGRPAPGWLEIDKSTYTGTVKSMPIRDELNEPALKEQYVVEYYSR
jgi:small subunit ribosomal protein S4